jgi:hypothetical protein
METFEFITPYGFVAVIRQLQGRHHKLLTTPARNTTEFLKKFDGILADCLISYGDMDTQKDGKIKHDYMPATDRKYIILTIFLFTYDFPEILELKESYKEDGRDVALVISETMPENRLFPFKAPTITYNSTDDLGKYLSFIHKGTTYYFRPLTTKSEKSLAAKTAPSSFDVLEARSLSILRNVNEQDLYIPVNMGNLGFRDIGELMELVSQSEGEVYCFVEYEKLGKLERRDVLTFSDFLLGGLTS